MRLTYICLFVLLNCCISTYSAYSQATTKLGPAPLVVDTTNYLRIFDENECRPKPSYPGGKPAYADFILTNMKYPKEAEDKDIQGRVLARFLVDEKGKISNVVIEEHVAGGCDDEVLRLISIMPSWIPGKKNGRYVKSVCRLPFMFKME